MNANMNNNQSNDQSIIFPVSPYAQGIPFLQDDATFYHHVQNETFLEQPNTDTTTTTSNSSNNNYQQGDDFRTSFYNPFEIKHRKRTSRAQFKVLEKTFLENPKPNAAIRRWLAQKLLMTPRGVQVWFQNRRAKEKTVCAKKPITSSPAVSPPLPQQLPQQLQEVDLSSSSPNHSVCTCNDCFATPMSRTLSYPTFYSDSSSNGEEEELLMTPVTPFVDTQAFAQQQQQQHQQLYDYPVFMNNNYNRKMTAPQHWMLATPTWPLANELSYVNTTNQMMFDQRRYSQPIIHEDRYVQSTEIFRRLSEPIFIDQELNFGTQFGLLPRNNSFAAI